MLNETVLEATPANIPVEPLLQLLVGFQKSQVLMTAQQLGIFRALASGGAAAGNLCRALSIPLSSGLRLLEACVSLNLLDFQEGKFRNSLATERYLTPGAPTYLGGLVDYYREAIYPALERLPRAILENRPQVIEGAQGADVFSAIERQKELGQRFTQAMHSLGLLEGHRLSRLFSFEPVSRILDLGGGSGALAIALAQAHPHLQVQILDRPMVCDMAANYIRSAQLEERIRVVPGDFWRDPWPEGADTILLSMILHDWGRDDGGRLLRHCFEALPPGGHVLVYEQLLDEDRCGPAVACLTNLTMLLRTSGGSESTLSDYTRLLDQAGFRHVQVYRSSGLRHLVLALKP